MNKLLLPSILVVAVILLGSCAVPSAPPPAPAPLPPPIPTPAPAPRPPLPPPLLPEINIGCVFPMTGSLATMGLRMRDSARLAVEEINAAGGIDGKTVRLLEVDDAGDPERSLSAVRRLVDESGVRIVVGPMTDETVKSVGPYASEKGILLISPSATSPLISEQPWTRWIFRTCPSDALQGKALADVAMAGNYSKIAILHVSDYNCSAIARTAERALEGKAEILPPVEYDQKKRDYSSELGKIKNKNPDCVLHIGYHDDSVLMYTQALEIGLDKVQWLASQHAYSQELFRKPQVALFMRQAVRGIRPAVLWKIREPLEPACPASAGTGFAVSWSQIEHTQDFASAYLRKFHGEPGTYCDTAYDCVKLAALAMEKVGVYDADKIRAALPDVSKSYVGASGVITFNEKGDRVSGIYEVWAVEQVGRKYKFVTTHLFAT